MIPRSWKRRLPLRRKEVPDQSTCAVHVQDRYIMATYVDILKSEFPEIDTEVFDYITGKS